MRVCVCVFIPVSCSAALSSIGEVAIIAGNNSALGLQVINHVTSLLAVSCCRLAPPPPKKKSKKIKKNRNNEEPQSNGDNEMNQIQDELIFFFFGSYLLLCVYQTLGDEESL